MDCKQVEALISRFIENDVTDRERKEISHHLKTCKKCLLLKENVERMIPFYPELQEDIPFFLKNRLYNIFESSEEKEKNYGYIRWVAAAIGTLVLFLNLFYFTNIFPAANKTLHVATARIEKFIVETKAFIEGFRASNDNVVSGLFKDEQNPEQRKEEQRSDKKGGKNG